MRCNNCGHELTDGEIYCEKCGRAIQIVPDFNVLEDDILPDLLSESNSHIDAELYGFRKVNGKKPNSRKFSLMAACFLGAFIIGSVYIFGTISHRIEPDEANAKESLPQESAAAGDTAEIAETEPVEEVYTSVVEFSEPGGSFSENIGLTLTASDGTSSVYYTTDGTDPTLHNGRRFDSKIYITSGITTIRAACINEAGKIGAVSEEVYTVTYEVPSMPVATPESGTYHDETYVTLTAPDDGVVMHYTWDGNNPTADSLVYSSPLLIPEGNHILSVIAIDGHGMTSDILRCNYVYIP